MKDCVFLKAGERFYKANLHCHTTESDGNLTPEETKKEYKNRGYSVVAFTDHCKYSWHRELDDEEFLALAAYEFQVDEQPWGNRARTYHVNLYDCAPWDKTEEKQNTCLPGCIYGDVEGLNKFVEKMRLRGFLACYNHPYWSLQTMEDYRGLEGFWAMEVYNYNCDQEGMYGSHAQAYDEMLRAGQKLFCVAADDNHDCFSLGHPLNDSFGGFIMIQAKEFSYQGIIKALKEGCFYSSMGPEIQALEVKDGKIVVKTSPVSRIYLKQQGRECRCAAAAGDKLEGAEFPLDGREGYVRVECRDARGQYAWSNAYFL